MLIPDTKLTGDIAEQATILQALKKGWNILKPLGDRLPYDMVFEISGKFVKIQVKAAWFEKRSGNYVVDTRRTKANRKEITKNKYSSSDFDFAIVYISDIEVFYIFPILEFWFITLFWKNSFLLHRRRLKPAAIYGKAPLGLLLF
jgi:hypothetical protein